jgi:hypothetical protein
MAELRKVIEPNGENRSVFKGAGVASLGGYRLANKLGRGWLSREY